MLNVDRGVQNMKKTTKTKQGTQETAIKPRLVKAGELAAREAVEAERKPEVKKAPPIDPALLRKPRNAVEARSMFEALFGDKAA
jgi:hypothetical protein